MDPRALRTGLAIALLPLVISVTAEAQTSLNLQGSTLSIGISGGTVNSLNSENAAIGEGNALGGVQSLAIGFYNTIDEYGRDNLSIGENVQLFGSTGSLGLGYYHDINGIWYGMVVGEVNSVIYVADSILSGSQNYFGYSSNSIVSGWNNYVTDLYSGAVFGDGLIVNNEMNHVIVGRFNSPSNPLKGSLFTVANGSGPAETQRSNAFVVYENGDVIVKKRQGDILMGEFGNPGD